METWIPYLCVYTHMQHTALSAADCVFWGFSGVVSRCYHSGTVFLFRRGYYPETDGARSGLDIEQGLVLLVR